MIGIDLGGSNLRAAFFAGDQKVREHRSPVGDDRSPAAIVERVARVIEELSDGTPCTAGIGIAALLRDRRGSVASSPHLGWRDVAFGELVATRLPAYKLGIYNDVNAVIWGEVTAGAARGCHDVLGVYVGTGIGGGIVANGRLVEGATNTAGEIGHTKIVFTDDAAPCQCGQRGCLEAYCGGRYVWDRVRAVFGDHVTPDECDRRATDGDPKALALWEPIATMLGASLANAAAILNPQMIVLGGGLLSRCPLLFELVEAAIDIAAPTAISENLLVRSAELGDDAGIVGAAHLATSGVLIAS
ncbi:MAG: ROK family protein [Kofleriaceae bacterium]